MVGVWHAQEGGLWVSTACSPTVVHLLSLGTTGGAGSGWLLQPSTWRAGRGPSFASVREEEAQSLVAGNCGACPLVETEQHPGT